MRSNNNQNSRMNRDNQQRDFSRQGRDMFRDDADQDFRFNDRERPRGDNQYRSEQGQNFGQYGSYQDQDYGYRSENRDRMSGRTDAPDYDHGYASETGRRWGGQDAEPRGQFSGKGPKGYKRSDERIREDVCEALFHDADVDASNIDVEVQDGVVTLSGSVEDRRTKRCAEDCVEQLSGVKDVTNNIRIETNTDSSRSMGSASSNGSTKSSARK